MDLWPSKPTNKQNLQFWPSFGVQISSEPPARDSWPSNPHCIVGETQPVGLLGQELHAVGPEGIWTPSFSLNILNKNKLYNHVMAVDASKTPGSSISLWDHTFLESIHGFSDERSSDWYISGKRIRKPSIIAKWQFIWQFSRKCPCTKEMF